MLRKTQPDQPTEPSAKVKKCPTYTTSQNVALMRRGVCQPLSFWGGLRGPGTYLAPRGNLKVQCAASRPVFDLVAAHSVTKESWDNDGYHESSSAGFGPAQVCFLFFSAKTKRGRREGDGKKNVTTICDNRHDNLRHGQ